MLLVPGTMEYPFKMCQQSVGKSFAGQLNPVRGSPVADN